MMRDELTKRINALPADTDFGIKLGDDHLDIADVVAWGEGDFGALTCYPVDLRDVLSEWDLSPDQLQRIVSSTSARNVTK